MATQSLPRPDEIPDQPDRTWPGLRPVGDRLRLAGYLRGIWRMREFVLEMPKGELRAQNQNTVVGNLWHLLNPLLLVAVYWLVFDVILNRAGGDRALLFGGDNYLGFLVVGIITYTYSGRALTAGARVVVKNRAMIQNITFPRAVLPISTMVTEAYAQVPALAVMLGLLLATGEDPSLTWLLLVPAFALQTVFNIGLAFVAGRVTFHFRDVLQILPYALRLLFYLSGIIFALDRVPEPLRTVLVVVNPFAAFVQLSRTVTLDNAVGGVEWVVVAVWAGLMAVGGFAFFRAAEQDFGRV